jgi:uncharacterized protein YdbL (DUF1318 family)
MKSFTMLGLFILVGCVVIPDTFDANINITIRHIEEQAEEVLDYVAGESEELPGISAAPKTDVHWFKNALRFLSPIQTAHAQTVKTTSPRVKQVADKMRQRNAEVTAIKKTGAVGENNRGLLELHKPDAISDAAEKNRIQRVMAAENEDRKALYKEIVNINTDQDLNVSTVEQIYAQKRLERAKTGDLFQLPPAGDNFNAFRGSPTGRKLGSKCKPNAWVTIP